MQVTDAADGADEAAKASVDLADLTAESVFRFLNSQAGSQNCPMCTTNTWQLVGPDDKPTLYAMPSITLFTKGMDAHQVLPVVALQCAKCYFVRFHNAVGIQLWSQENPDD